MPTKIKNANLTSVVIVTIMVCAIFLMAKTRIFVRPMIVPSVNDGLEVSVGQTPPKTPSNINLTDDITYCWDNIRLGDQFFKNEDYAKAAEAYKRAYSIRNGSKAVSGLWLVRSYEKLGRYGEGIALLDQMTERGELSQKGTQNANEIKSRLIAAKSHASQTQPTQNS